VDDAHLHRVATRQHLAAQRLEEAASAELAAQYSLSEGCPTNPFMLEKLNHVPVAGGDEVRQERLRRPGERESGNGSPTNS
jgi:hypothetical protein